MSATGRNLAGAERHPDDFYATPAWVVRAVLPHVVLGPCPLDPAAGDGAILRVIDEDNDDGERHPWGLEIDAGRATAARAAGFVCDVADALGPATWCEPSAVVMNPPFALAMPFVERALQETTGEVVALLRLAFLESAGRAGFHKANPADVFVLANRPSFVQHLKWETRRCDGSVPDPKGKPKRCELEAGHAGAEHRTLGTDSAAYAWLRWPSRENRGPSYPARIRVLEARAAGAPHRARGAAA